MNPPRLDIVPPQNNDAERAVLGAMMHPKESSTVIPRVLEIVSDSNIFYREAHQHIFDAIINIFESGKAVDLLTVIARLEINGHLEHTGGVAAIDEMIDASPTGANAHYYAEIVKKAATRRKTILAATKLYQDALDATEEIDTVIDRGEQALLDIRLNGTAQHTIAVKAYLKSTFTKIQSAYQNPGQLVGLETGFPSLDKKIGGLMNEYIVVGARPSMGKSTLVQNIAQHVAMQNHVPVLIFSPEMSGEEICNRFLASEAQVDLMSLRTGTFEAHAWPRITIAAGLISEAPIFIDDTVGITPTQIRAKCYQIANKHNLGLIIVDYIQLIEPDSIDKKDNREGQVRSISAALKGLGRDFKVPIVVVAQLNRNLESRANKRPMLSDLRESGALEQDADTVLFLYREEYYVKSGITKPTELLIAKQRNGPTGLIKLVFNPQHVRFRELAKGHNDLAESEDQAAM